MTVAKRVLMVAYHFPPLAGSSGIQRTLRFVQQLPRFGWEPVVLTISPHAYERTNLDLDADVPPGTTVCRAFGLDTARHLSVRGRYVGSMARPDRWVSWKHDGVRQGLRLIRELRPQVLWSTYPIATAHLIGAELQRRSGLPWIADFRDPMAQDGYPADPATHRQFEQIEAHALRHAQASVFTTPGCAEVYARRYPEAADRIALLENGYDEDSFADAERQLTPQRREPLHPGAVTLLHSGIVYPSERDPTQLVEALARLHARGVIRPGQLKLRFRAAVHDALLQQLAQRHGVQAYVETLPAIGYREALAEMLRADALLVLQAANCNEQVPAKIYEYLRARRPILCLSDAAGDTARVLRSAGTAAFAQLADAADIARRLETFLGELRAGSAAVPDEAAVAAASRLSRTEALAGLFDRLHARKAA